MKGNPASDERGQMLIIVALMMTVLLAAAGLALDLGVAMVQQVRAQDAGDAAALAGAADLPGSPAGAMAAATQYATDNGFTNGVNGISLTVASPPTSSKQHNGDPDGIQVTITQKIPTVLMRVVGIPDITVTTRSVAIGATGAPCALCVLSPTTPGAFAGNGNGSIDVTGAGVVVNSDSPSAATLTGNGGVTASSVSIVGGYSTSGNAGFQPTPTTGAFPVPDPLRSVPAPSLAGANEGSVSVSGNSSRAIDPGIYTNLSLSGNGNLTLHPGVYVITGSVSISGSASLTGQGVTLYFTCGAYSSADTAPCQGAAGGSLDLSGNGSYQVSGPTGGTYQGLAVFYDRGDTAGLTLTGNGSDNFTGTIYAKSADADLSGNGGVDQVNSLVIANTVTLSGNGGVNIAYNAAQNYPVHLPPRLTQ